MSVFLVAITVILPCTMRYRSRNQCTMLPEITPLLMTWCWRGQAELAHRWGTCRSSPRGPPPLWCPSRWPCPGTDRWRSRRCWPWSWSGCLTTPGPCHWWSGSAPVGRGRRLDTARGWSWTGSHPCTGAGPGSSASARPWPPDPGAGSGTGSEGEHGTEPEQCIWWSNGRVLNCAFGLPLPCIPALPDWTCVWHSWFVSWLAERTCFNILIIMISMRCVWNRDR